MGIIFQSFRNHVDRSVRFLRISRFKVKRNEIEKSIKFAKNVLDRLGSGKTRESSLRLTWRTGGGDRGSGVGRLAHLSMAGQVAAVSILHP